MNILISTLKEELKTAKQLEHKYLKRLKECPRGSFIIRIRGSKRYGYLTSREGGKVIQQYVGAVDEAKIEQYYHSRELKRDYRKKLKNVREQIKILKKALRGKTT